MKKCHQCQHENSASANFCNSCGANLKVPESVDKSTLPSTKRKAKKLAERRQLTILFCDLVGSTPLSEQLDPEEYRQVITGYHEVAEKVISRHGGHIAQYLGDGLLVYFGYPRGLEDAPRAGVRTGLGILEAVAKANLDWEAAGKTSIKVRIGIHTGLVVVDDHLALGDTVNIAARLEGLAPHNSLVISPQTLSLVQGWYEVKNMGEHVLKGISEPMEVFEVLGESGAKTSLEVAKGKGLSPLVGRQDELNTLRQYWMEAKRGKGRLLLLNGEAGIGKSRLVDTLVEQVAQEPDMRVLVARCSTYFSNSAFHPLIELLEQVVLQFESKNASEDKLNKLEAFVLQSRLDYKTTMSLFAEFLSIPSEAFPPLVMSPVAKRQRTMERLTQAFVNRATEQPILFVLEDLHWADPSTLEWLKLTLEQVPKHSIFMLCTTRPAFRPEWADRAEIILINLQRLSAENMIDICHHQTKGKILPKEILEQIADKTEGVPLFVEELAKMIMESDFLLEKSDGFELTEAVSALNIPSTLQDSLLARLDRLPNVKDLVQMGAVLGREFSFEMLNAVVPRKVDSMEQSLSKLLDAEIFYLREVNGGSVYQFKHALIQETAYGSLLKSRRQQLHHRVANVLEHHFSDISQTQPEILAHHYTEASQPLQAIPIWLQAGHLASQKNASFEAISHLEKGIGLLPHIKEEAQRNNLELDFRLILGGTFVASHGFPHPKVKETFNLAREIAQNIEVDPKLALVLFNLLSYYFNIEDYKAHDELLEYVIQLKDDSKMGYWFDLVSCQMSQCSMVVRGDFEPSLKGTQRSLEIFNPSLPFPWELAPSGYLEIAAKAWGMFKLQILGHMDQAKKLFDQHLSFAEDHKDSMTLYHVYTFPALYSLEAREWKTAETIMATYLPIVRDFGDPIFTLTAEVYYYTARAFQGDKMGFDMTIKLINVCFDVGFKAFAVTMSSFIAEKYFQDGEYESALSWIEKILDHVKQTGTHIRTAELLRIKGLTLKALGKETIEVEDYFQQALELSRKQSAKTFELRAACDLARLWQEQGESKEAYDLVRGVYDWFTEGHDSVDLQQTRDLMTLLK